MKALTYDDVHGLRLEAGYPKPLLKSSEAMIRPVLTGLCATDLEIVKGYMGFAGVLGHEFVGIVEQAKDETLVGKRVVGEINASCGICDTCKAGNQTHCEVRSVLGILNRDGVFADFFTLPAENLHIVPDTVSDEEAVFTEPLSAAFKVLEQVNITKKSSVACLGDGRLGQLVAQVVKTTGCSLVLVGKHHDKLKIASKMGIETMMADEAFAREREYDIVIDSTGATSGIDMAFRMVKPRGIIVLKTTVNEKRAVDLNRLVIDEITVVGSRCGSFVPALQALQKGVVNVKPLITDILPFDDAIGVMGKASFAGLKTLFAME